MNGVKGLLTSKTIWGLIFAAISAVFPSIGAKLSLIDQNSWIDGVAKFIEVASLFYAGYGRIMATKQIVSVTTPTATTLRVVLFLFIVGPMLSACASVTPGVTSASASVSQSTGPITVLDPAVEPVTVAPASTTAGKVQRAVAATCSFLPTIGVAASVAATFTDYGDQVALAKTTAASICASLHDAGYVSLHGKKPRRQRAPAAQSTSAVVNGVPVQGAPVTKSQARALSQ